MNEERKWKTVIKKILPYAGVGLGSAVLAVVVTLLIVFHNRSKLYELENIIDQYYIDDYSKTAIEDAAATAMVDALGNRWSYYIPASEYQAHVDRQENSYVGIGITIVGREDGLGFEIIKVEPGSGAEMAGVLPGDVLTKVEGQSVVDLGTDGTASLIRGDAGTKVNITVLRSPNGSIDTNELPDNIAEHTFSVERKTIQTTVATGTMLEGNIGLITIANFNSRCASETIAAIENLRKQGATALIFDVRNNPGGFKDEMVQILDYLLPAGDLFRSEDYAGRTETDTSNANHLKMPMAVLLNGNSYSAAEFFAAALDEYDWATVVGEASTGKSHFQVTIPLRDGSAVNLSIGKYYTPKGVSLADVGGLQPEVLVEVDDETEMAIYAGTLSPQEDPQIQRAVEVLKTGN